MHNAPTLWVELAAAAAVELSTSQRERLSRYLDLLLEANQTMNLTAIIDRAAAELLHVADALTLLPHLPRGTISIADIGSGGGAPAIPLAIARPDATITCIEATGKKAAFLEKAAADLELKNVRVLARRAEDVGRGPPRETFNIATARAVGKMAWVAEFALPLVKIGGKALAMKGPRAAAELVEAGGAIGKLGGGKAVVHPVNLPGTDGHVIVEIAKLRHTGARFPRLPSHARGEPLK